MKLKALRSVLVCLLVLASLSLAGAAYAEDNTLPDPGITPDSPLYFFDNLGKQLGMFFTFGAEAKARKALRYAEERLAEASAMAEKHRVREMERAADSYNGYMAQVRQRLENRGASDNVCERVALAAARHLEVLETVREKAPPEADAAIERARTATMSGQIVALRSLAKDRPNRAIDIISDTVNGQIERAAARLAGKVTSANVTAEVARALDCAARLAALEDEMTAQAEKNGIDVTPMLQRLQQSTANRLQVLSGVYENAPEDARAGIENAIENSFSEYERSLNTLQEQAASANVSGSQVLMQQMRTELTERLRNLTASLDSDNVTPWRTGKQ
jgi:hypothetical protein